MFDEVSAHNQKKVQFTSPGGSPINRDGLGDAVLMVTPQSVPEPAGLAASALPLLGFIKRRRK